MPEMSLQHVLVRVLVESLGMDRDVVHKDGMKLSALVLTKRSERGVHEALEDTRALLRAEVEYQRLKHPSTSYQSKDITGLRRE